MSFRMPKVKTRICRKCKVEKPWIFSHKEDRPPKRPKYIFVDSAEERWEGNLCPSCLKEWRDYKSIYQDWNGMMSRCYNPKMETYVNYGARGIIVEPEWHDPRQYGKDMGKRPPGMTLDRIDYTKNYCKENCRWASPKEQARNRRSNTLIEYRGEVKCIAEWADIFGIDQMILSHRLAHEWTAEEAFNTPPKQQRARKKIIWEGKEVTLTSLARKCGIEYFTLRGRLEMGWDLKRDMETPTKEEYKLEFDGKSKTVKEWAAYLGIEEKIIRHRLYLNWDLKDVFSNLDGSFRKTRKVIYRGKEVILTHLAREVGIGYCTLRNRLNQGWSIEDAVGIPVKKTCPRLPRLNKRVS